MGANASNLMSENVSKSCCVIHLNTFLINVVSERETPTNAYSVRSSAKITVHALSELILPCASLVKQYYFNAKGWFALMPAVSKPGP